MSLEAKLFTGGGQTLFHGLRMLAEVIKKVIIFSVLMGFICGTTYFHYHTSAGDSGHLLKWVNAHIKDSINPQGTIEVKTQSGTYKEKVAYYFKSPERIKKIQPVIQAFWESIRIGIYGTLSTFGLCVIWFVRRGKKQQESRLLKGTYVLDTRKFAKHIRKTGKTSTLTLAGIQIYRNIECQHMLVHGSTGTGKSVMISELLDGIRARGDKAIIYDKHGGYIQHYYRADQDMLLNPLDARGCAWHFWAEARGAADFDHMAAGLMPHPPAQGSDPFWINAARTIFASTAFKMANDPEKSIAKLLNYLFTDDLGELSALLAGTEAATLVSDRAEKTALSVKSVLATYLKMLKYLKHEKSPFSIRQWVTDDEQKNWLFVSSRADQHESLKPLMSLWLDLAANALLSAGENPNRRLWLIVDEMPSLQRLPYLPAFMAEGRKFGGCFVGGVQSYYQIQKIYGQDGAKEIVDLCNTRAFFRAPSHESAEWVSKELGDSELIEARDGISYGANNVRDGVSINQQRVVRPAVSVSDINKLPDLQGYISIPPLGKTMKQASLKNKPIWPVGKFKLVPRKRPIIADGFIELKISEVAKETPEPTNTQEQPADMVKPEEAKPSTDTPSSSRTSEVRPVQEDAGTSSPANATEKVSDQANGTNEVQNLQKVNEALPSQPIAASQPELTKAVSQDDVNDDEFPYR